MSDELTDLGLNLRVVDVDTLTPHPRNYNQHSESQVGELGQSLGDFGQYKNVVCWTDPDNGRLYILAGHGLLEAAKVDGRARIAVNDRSDLTRAQAMALMFSDNFTTSTDFDYAILSDLVTDEEFPKGVPGLSDEALAEILEMATVEDDGGGSVEDVAPQIDRAAELQEVWGTALGQIWELGAHRLACGDCTDEAVVAGVMGGDAVAGVVTDPPYAFGLASTSSLATKAGGWHDMMNNASWFADRIKQWKGLVLSGPMWVFCNWRTLPILMRAAFDSGVGISSVLVWYKDWIGPGGIKGLRPTYELVALIVLGDYAIPNRGMQDFFKSPWSSHKPSGHAAEKPAALLEHIVDESKINIVFDPFLGSGTTLIACERLNRKCRAIEIEPKYVAVTLQRYLDATGKTPQLIGSI